MIQVAKIIGTGLIGYDIDVASKTKLVVNNTYFFLKIKKKLKFKSFSTSSSLLVDNNSSSEGDNNSNKNNENNSDVNNDDKNINTNNNKENNWQLPLELENSSNNSPNNLNSPNHDTSYTVGQGDVVLNDLERRLLATAVEERRKLSAVYYSLLGWTKDDNAKDSSLTNKKKLAEDEDSIAQPSKKIKQDSSDITANTEPYDITGGEDC